MKKVISILLAALMLMSCMAFGASAVEGVCTCNDHIAGTDGSCRCCVYCPNIDKSYVLSCVTKNENGEYSFCCYDCDGIWPCDCGCECCEEKDQDIDNIFGDPILSDDTQNDIVSAFQRMLKEISDWFDEFFNAIFEFLRFDDIMGNN